MSALPKPSGDAATVSVVVEVAPDVAFDIFTREIDLWWRHGPQYRFAGRVPGALTLEPGLGGRLFEAYASESGPHVLERGRVIEWAPPTRLAFEWRANNFVPGERTLVEVSFEPSAAGTRVTVRHSGWAALRPGHPARHGLEGAAVSRMIGQWWGVIMSGLREYAAERG
jgi:uncharacterized protein YndB with AHSA1/START domain